MSPRAEFRLAAWKTRTLRNEISQKRTDCEPHCCQFASKRRCGSYAAPSNVSATTAAALRTDGAAPLSIPCCAAARSAMLQRAAPRARGPRAAHHEPGAREPESVAASVQFSRRPRRARVRDLPRRRRIDGVRKRRWRGAHTTVNAQAHEAAARVAAPEARRGKKSYESRQHEGPTPGAQGPAQAQARPGEAEKREGS